MHTSTHARPWLLGCGSLVAEGLVFLLEAGPWYLSLIDSANTLGHKSVNLTVTVQ